MLRRLIHFVAGLLLGLIALFLFGIGAGVLIDAVQYHVLPVVLHVASCQMTELENPAEVNPDLEGEIVEIYRTPVRCDAVLEDEDFGVRVRAAALWRYWVPGEGNREFCPDEVDGFAMRYEAAAPEFRMGPYRIKGEQTLRLWRGETLAVQPSRIPEALAPYMREGETHRICLPEAGEQTLVYSAVEDGTPYSFIGRQVGDTLVHDADAARMAYLSQWRLAPGGVWEDVWSSLPGLTYACLLFAGAALLLRMGVSQMSGGFELYRVSFLWPTAVTLCGMLASEVCYAAGNRAGFSGGQAWGDAIFLVTLTVLVGLCLIRRRTTAPVP